MKSVCLKRVFIILFALSNFLGAHNFLKTEELTPKDIDLRLNTRSAALTTPNSPQTVVYSSLNVEVIEVWNNSSGDFCKNEIPNPEGTTAIAITPKGNIIVAACFNGPIKVWQKKENDFGRPLQLPNSNSWTTALAITPDGKMIVAGSPQIANQPLKIWQKKGGQFVEKESIPIKGSINAIATPDAKTIVIGEIIGTSDEGECHSQPVRILGKQPDGKFVLTHTLPNSTDVVSIATTPDASIIVAAGLLATLRSWRLQDDNCEYSQPCPIGKALFDVKALAIDHSKNIVFIDHHNELRPTTVGLPIP